MTCKLYYGTTCIGRITGVMKHQGTFFGDFNLTPMRELDAELERIVAIIDFCHQWQARQIGDDPPKSSAFDPFTDLINSRQWTTVEASGEQRHLGITDVVRRT